MKISIPESAHKDEIHIGESVAVLIAIEQHRGVAHQIYFHQWIIRVSVRKSLPNLTKIVERECI